MTDNLRCKHCDKEFRYESEKKRHELSHSPRFQCEICNKKFSFISALKRHEKQHQRIGKVNCQQCSRSFRDDSLLQRHIKYAHKGKYICEKCNTEFHSELALSTHEKTHNAKSERKYQCRHKGCGKTFNFPHHLKHHEMTHTNSKQHHCHICKKGFIQSHHLKSHMKTHEPENWLHCMEKDCKKTFPTEYSRKRHLLQVHNIKLDNMSAEFSQANSDTESLANDSILCTACGDIVDLYLFKDHQSKCSLEDGHVNENVKEQGDKFEDSKKNPSQIDQFNDDRVINDCKSALGSCIMSGDGTENCLCAQIKTTVDDYYDNELSVDENINSTNVSLNLNPSEIFNSKSTNPSKNPGCETCGCISNSKLNLIETDDICNNKQYMSERNCLYNLNNNIPDIEYKIDGSIKLKDTFDLDIKIFERNIVENKKDKTEEMYKSNYVPFKSCEAALGKCIVSVNGAISDECLCARMLVDDKLMTEEEIDEITPHPTVS